MIEILFIPLIHNNTIATQYSAGIIAAFPAHTTPPDCRVSRLSYRLIGPITFGVSWERNSRFRVITRENGGRLVKIEELGRHLSDRLGKLICYVVQRLLS